MFQINIIIIFSVSISLFIIAVSTKSIKHRDKVSVLIVGAGPSGLAAGQKLYENGFNVTILEAENRYGGRVHSVQFGDAYVDLGAEWCHGEEDNVVYQMVKDLNVLTHSHYNYHLYYSDRFYISEEFDSELDELFDATYTSDGNRKQPIDTTLGEYCIRAFNSTIRSKWSNGTEEFRRAMMCLDTFQRYALSDEGAFCWYDVAATSDYRECEGDIELNWSGLGYKTALEVLMKCFPKIHNSCQIDKSILLNKEVTEIIYKDNFTVALCSDGSGYIADHLIFTGSLGVLKHYHKTLFKPPLGPEKVKVIKELGIAAVCKIILHFPHRWWPSTNFTGWTFVWTYEDKEMLYVEFPYGPRRYGTHWLSNIMCAFRLEKNPRGFSLWFTGDFVPDIETMDEEILVNGIMFTFDKFFGDKYKLVKPDKIIRGNWFSNPHFHGTYSYQTVPSRKHFVPSPNAVLAEPVYSKSGVPILLFAGEATHPYYYSTVHGAIETGFREADRLIEFYSS